MKNTLKIIAAILIVAAIAESTYFLMSDQAPKYILAGPDPGV